MGNMPARMHSAAGGAAASCSDRETDAAALSSTTLPVLSAISSTTQHNTCNAMKAKYSVSGQ